MRTHLIIGSAIAAVLVGCSASLDEGEICTRQAVGRETGAASIDVTLWVPKEYGRGVHTSNGGVKVFARDCDAPINAFLSQETIVFLIANAPGKTLTERNFATYRIVDASIDIWRFRDISGETRFFITDVFHMRPVLKGRDSVEQKLFILPDEGR